MQYHRVKDRRHRHLFFLVPYQTVQKELVKQLAQVVTSAAAVAGRAVSGIIAAPGNVPRTGRYIVGTIQSLAVI